MDQISRNAFQVSPIHLSHTLNVHELPNPHRDPFDRILVSQATLEEMPLLSADPQIPRYPAEVVW